MSTFDITWLWRCRCSCSLSFNCCTCFSYFMLLLLLFYLVFFWIIVDFFFKFFVVCESFFSSSRIIRLNVFVSWEQMCIITIDSLERLNWNCKQYKKLRLHEIKLLLQMSTNDEKYFLLNKKKRLFRLDNEL